MLMLTGGVQSQDSKSEGGNGSEAKKEGQQIQGGTVWSWPQLHEETQLLSYINVEVEGWRKWGEFYRQFPTPPSVVSHRSTFAPQGINCPALLGYITQRSWWGSQVPCPMA